MRLWTLITKIWDNKLVGWVVAQVWAFRHRKWRATVNALTFKGKVIGWTVTYWPPDSQERMIKIIWGNEQTCETFVKKEKPK